MSNSASSFTGVSSGYTAGTPVPADSPIRDNIADAVRRVRETTPLAQSFTNFVTINLVANAQLAAGGTAAMSFLPDDVIETAKIAGANYINVGTLLPFFKEVSYPLGVLGFVILTYLVIVGSSNAVNLTDGLDGLDTGAAPMAFAAYALVNIWQNNQSCSTSSTAGPQCYWVRDPRDLALVSLALPQHAANPARENA